MSVRGLFAGAGSQPSGGGGATYRYWRIYVQTNNGDTSYISIGEIELRGSAGGADLTTPSTPVTASTVASGTVKESIVDNLLDNASWITSNGFVTNEWVRLDLGVATFVSQVAMYNPGFAATRSPKDFIVQGSSDGTNFTNVKSFTNVTGWTAALRTFDL